MSTFEHILQLETETLSTDLCPKRGMHLGLNRDSLELSCYIWVSIDRNERRIVDGWQTFVRAG